MGEILLFLSSILLILYTIVVRRSFYRLKGEFEVKNDQILFGHGVVTIARGIRLNVLWSSICPFLFIIEFAKVPINQVCLIVILSGSIARWLYPLSEVKHLSDNLRKFLCPEAFKMYKMFFLVGLWGLFENLSIAVLANLSVVDYSIIVGFVVVAYVLSMAELLQTRGIDKSDLDDLRYGLDIVSNIIAAIFKAPARAKAFRDLRENTYHILKGMRIMIASFL